MSGGSGDCTNTHIYHTNKRNEDRRKKEDKSEVNHALGTYKGHCSIGVGWF